MKRAGADAMFGVASMLHKSLRGRGMSRSARTSSTPLIEPLEARQLLSAAAAATVHHAHTKHVKLHRSVAAGPQAVVAPPVVTSPHPRLIIGTGLALYAHP